MSKASLKSIVIFSRQVSKTQDFFTDVLGLKLLHSSNEYAELTDGKFSFMLREAPTLAHATHGFSPMLSFELADIDAACLKAKDEY